jgi:hypothetical protein
VTVASRPTGAAVYRADGRRLGTTPLPLSVRRGASTRVRIEREGYRSATVTLPGDDSGPVTVDLRAARPD